MCAGILGDEDQFSLKIRSNLVTIPSHLRPDGIAPPRALPLSLWHLFSDNGPMGAPVAIIQPHHYRLFAEQPECFANFPVSILPPDLEEKLRAAPGLAIAEIAGRDSIAAAIWAVRQERAQSVLPTLAYNGAQFGSLDTVSQAVTLLRDRLGPDRVFDLVMIGAPRFWKALTLRFADRLTEQFGFYTGYVACHLYLHVVRIPLARRLNCSLVVSGERESHDGDIKLNQTRDVLNAYSQIMREFQIELDQPLRHLASGHDVVEILGTEWKQGDCQLHCVLSGNYRNPDGSVDFGDGCRFNDAKSSRFLREFGLPLVRRTLARALAGEDVDYGSEAQQQLDDLSSPPVPEDLPSL